MSQKASTSFRIGQVIRQEGPMTHRQKPGRRRWAGCSSLTAALVTKLLWADLTNVFGVIAMGTTTAVRASVCRRLHEGVRQSHHGLRAYKMGYQIHIATTVGVVLLVWGNTGSTTTCIFRFFKR